MDALCSQGVEGLDDDDDDDDDDEVKVHILGSPKCALSLDVP